MRACSSALAEDGLNGVLTCGSICSLCSAPRGFRALRCSGFDSERKLLCVLHDWQATWVSGTQESNNIDNVWRVSMWRLAGKLPLTWNTRIA